MANGDDDPRIYQALVLTDQALEKGGVEILRAGIIDDDLHVTARPVFQDPGKWGEVLAEIAERLGAIYAAELTGMNKKDVTVQIVEAFAAELGAKPITSATTQSKKAANKTVKSKAAKKKTAAPRKKR